MEENRISVGFIWLPSEAELASINPKQLTESLKSSIESLKKYLSRLFDLSVDVHELRPKNSSSGLGGCSSMSLTEYIFSVTCIITFESNILKSVSNVDIFKKIIKMFCSRVSNSDFPNLYLSYDTSVLIEKDLRTEDYFTYLEGFSLGNIVKLNNYVSHFNSDNSLNQYDYKITQTKVKFLHDQEMFHMNFVVGKVHGKVKERNASTHRMFQLNIPYSSIHSIVISDAENFSAYIRLYRPPMLYTVKQNEDAESYVSYFDLSSKTYWFRAVDLFENCPSNIRQEFSLNSVLCLNFHKEDYNILRIFLHHKNIQVYFAFMNIIPYKPIPISLQVDDFDCYYGYQCLLTHSHEILDHLMTEEEINIFRNFMKEKSKENSKALSESLYKIYSAISKCNVVIFNFSLKCLYEKYKSEIITNKSDDKNHEQKTVNVKRAIIIPTHIQFLPPAPILKSRALCSCNPEYSLRIYLRDVNLDTINKSYRGFDDERQTFLRDFFEKYYKKPMLDGIKIGKRTYMYIGGSTSQLRGHGLWFYAEDDKGKTAQMLRKELGDIDKIEQVPKYMARMGQTFSQAINRIRVPQKYTNVDFPDEDIKGEIKQYLSEDDLDDHNDNDLKPANEYEKYLKEISIIEPERYTFSDGIGRISMELVKKVCEALELKHEPSAMQIRYAGCKGMLVVDPKLKGEQIRFRKSMHKFASSNNSLEIIKVSEKRAASLNRFLITILEQLGIHKNVFVKLQKEMIQNHIKSMFHEPDACDFLNRNSKLRFDFKGLHRAGISYTEDPLFRSMIYALFQKNLDLLKHKANIEIPVNKGRAMFGVLDETFTLTYGQVFVQYTDWNSDETHILGGAIVVTKNPCMHPGDVRKFQAVDVKDLHHIRDCIVFPAQGQRPHPDEMAGSDLDGDEYHVIWYEDLIFRRDNVSAMHFAIRKATSEGNKGTSKDNREVQPAQELDHLCNYIINDNVGVIANAHLAFADREKKGIFSENCIRLAKKYAIALDFAKSGKKATRNAKDRAFSYPDFMQKFGERDTYVSKNALGVLYRNCKRLEMRLETTSTDIDYKLDNDLILENWKKYERSALRTYNYYCRKIEHLMNLYSFSSEGELLAGAIINPPKYYEQRHDLDNLMTLLEHEMKCTFNELEKIFFQDFGGKPKDRHFTEEMHQKASAWYNVAYNKVKGEMYNFFGLPWAVSDVLIGLKERNSKLKKNRIANSKSVLEDIVDKSLKNQMHAMSEETETYVIYENRLEVLDVASIVLSKWLETHQSYVLIDDLKKFKKLVNNEFQTVSKPLLCRDLQYIEHLKNTNDLKKALSPSYYIIETLLHLACIKMPSHEASFNDSHNELSLLSWVTLIKLACTYNPIYLGIANEDRNLPNNIYFLPQDTIVSTFKINLFDKHEYNDEFSMKLLHKPSEIKKYLMNVSKLREINFRYDIDKEKKNVAIFTVEGSRYAIEKLKDLVIQEGFFKWVVKERELFATQS